MKKLFALVLVLSMLLGTALAADATYTTTQKAVEVLELMGMEPVCKGLDSDGDDVLYIDYTDEENNISYTFRLFFDDDLGHCFIRVWYLFNVSSANLTDMMHACNTANCSYKYAKFYVDESDNTVSVDMDLIFNEDDDMGISVWEGVERLKRVIAAAYPDLAVYGK